MRQILETEEHVQIPPVMYSDPFYRISYLIKEEVRKYKWFEGEKGRKLSWKQALQEWTDAYREKYLLRLRNLLCAGSDVLLLVCGFSLFLFLRRVLVRGFRRFVTHDPKIKVHHKRRQPARRNASSCGNCPRDTDSA